MTDRVQTEELAARIRATLHAMPEAELPVTYGVLAARLSVPGPGSIRRLTEALELTMRQDAAQGRPPVAALVVARLGGGLPAPGFFELAAKLSCLPEDPQAARAAYPEMFQRALEAR